eukprot:g22732.t1
MAVSIHYGEDAAAATGNLPPGQHTATADNNQRTVLVLAGKICCMCSGFAASAGKEKPRPARGISYILAGNASPQRVEWGTWRSQARGEGVQ